MSHPTRTRASAALLFSAASLSAALPLCSPGPARAQSIISPGPVLNQPNLTIIRPFTLASRNGSANDNDAAYAVCVGSDDRVVTAGVLRNTGTGADFTVLAYRGSNTPGWLRTLDGTAATDDDQALAVATDSQRNILAAGYLLNDGTGRDFTVAKWDPAGNLLWTRSLDSSSATAVDDRAFALAVDNEDNVVAAGRLGTDFAVMRWDAAGSPCPGWRLNGNPAPRRIRGNDPNGTNAALSVAVDSQRNIIAAGYITRTTYLKDFAVMKWDEMGNESWGGPYRFGGSIGGAYGFTAYDVDDAAQCVKVDSADHIIAGGYVHRTNGYYRGGDYSMCLVKIRPDGSTDWRRDVRGDSLEGDNCANDIAVDRNDSIYIAGRLWTRPEGTVLALVRLSPAGTTTMQRTMNGTMPGDSWDEAYSVVVDANGNAIIGGTVQAQASNYDFVMARYSPTGALLWSCALTGSAYGGDYCRAVAVDSTGLAIGVGQVRNATVNTLFTNTAANDYAVAM